jgi:hypothetical protein
MLEIFGVIFMAILIGLYSAGLWYFNSKVVLDKDGVYESTDETTSNTQDILKTIVSVVSGGWIYILIMMLLFFGFVLFDPEFLPK